MSSEPQQATEPLISDEEIDACWTRLGVEKKTDSLNFRQFCLALEELGFRWSIDDAKTVFKTMDSDKSKDISYAEFKNAVNVDLPAFEKFWSFLIKPPESNQETNEEDKKPLNIDEMIEALNSVTSDWKIRQTAINQLKEQCKDMTSEDFTDLMKDLTPAFQKQLGERRSVIIRDVSVCIVEICKAHGDLFSKYVPQLFPYFFKCVRMNVQVISKSGMMACANIVRNAKEDDELNVLRACLLGFDEPHDFVREVCFTYIATILEINDLNNQSEKFWELVFEALQNGVNDSDSKARTQCYNAIKIMKQKNEGKYKEYFAQLVKAEQKRVMRALGIKAKRKKMKRKRPIKNKRLKEITKEEATEAQTPFSALTPLSQEDLLQRESLADSEKRKKLELEKEEADKQAASASPPKDTPALPRDSESVIREEDMVIPLKEAPTTKKESEDISEIDWRKQSEDEYAGNGTSPSSPKAEETFYFLNSFGYKQKATVREKNGDKLVVEWIPNDRRYSHTGVDVRNIDEPSHLTQDMIESSTRSIDITESTTGCNCIIS